jgi:hypothetical protein
MKHAWILLATVGAAVGFAQMPEDKPEEAVNGSWTGEGGRSFTVKGVCDIDEKTVSCWNLQGVVDPKLAEEMKSRLLSSNNGQDLGFKFGKKNRYFLYEAGSQQFSPQFTSSDGSYLQAQPFSYNGNDIVRGYGHLVAEANTTSINVMARFNGLPGPKAVTVPFKEGSKVTYDGLSITVGGWKKGGADPNRFNGFSGGYSGSGTPGSNSDRGWQLFFEMQPGTQYVNLGALDREGQPIVYVDPKGRPVSELEYLKHAPKNRFGAQPMVSTNEYAMATYNAGFGGQSLPHAVSYGTNVDPKYIDSLTISATRNKSVLIKNLPLDPVSSVARIRD